MNATTLLVLQVDLRPSGGSAILWSKPQMVPPRSRRVEASDVRALCDKMDHSFDCRPPLPARRIDDAMRATGRALTAMLIDEQMNCTLREMVARSSDEQPLRFVYTHVESDELAWRIPVEWMADAEIGIFSLNGRILFSRSVIARPTRASVSSPADRPMLLLSWAATHGEKNPLGAALEREVLETNLRMHEIDSIVDHRACPSASPASLRNAMIEQGRARRPIDVWHHCGHGSFDTETSEAALVLHDDRMGREARTPLSGSGMAAAGLFRHGLRFALFNVCKSARGGGLVRAAVSAGVPAVLGHLHEIDDMAAIQFSEHFWRELQTGTIDSATAHGRRAIGQRAIDWGLPVLYLTDPGLSIFAPRARGRVKNSGCVHGE